jgi:hypothetical protein
MNRIVRIAACLLTIMVLLMTACSRAEAPAGRQNPQPTTAKEVIEGITGKTAVDAGRRTQEKVRAISAERNRDLGEALGK